MKLSATIIGGQLLLAALAFATPIVDTAAGSVAARSPAPLPEPVPGCIKERGTDEDAVNVCCLKLKRDAEVSADDASAKSKAFEKAMAIREKLGSLIARDAFPGCIKERGTDEDAVNVCCLKLKRDAEAAATDAANAYSSYAQMLKYRSV